MKSAVEKMWTAGSSEFWLVHIIDVVQQALDVANTPFSERLRKIKPTDSAILWTSLYTGYGLLTVAKAGAVCVDFFSKITARGFWRGICEKDQAG
jgi:hypothetical protein